MNEKEMKRAVEEELQAIEHQRAEQSILGSELDQLRRMELDDDEDGRRE